MSELSGELKDIRLLFWQACTSVSKNSWCYIDGHDYKNTPPIIHDLIDAVSKNGSLLLNIGPRADGTIPEREQDMLHEIGRWLAVNGEAIYGTRPFKVYGEGPTVVTSSGFNDATRADFSGSDVRFTTNGSTLYAILLGYPDNGKIAIQSPGTNTALYASVIGQIELLGTQETVQWARDTDALRIKLPPQQSREPAYMLKIEA